MPVTNPVSVSGSGSNPSSTPSVSTSTSPLTVVILAPATAPEAVAQSSTMIPIVPRQRRSLDSTTGNIYIERDVEKKTPKNIEFLHRQIYYVEQERVGAETRILKLRDELHALQEIEWNVQRVEDFLGRLKLGGEGEEKDQGEGNEEDVRSDEILKEEEERDG
ncbi:hypothetical protein ACHAPG_008930 [Botrytis cinerea]